MQHGDSRGTRLSTRIAGQAVIEQLIRSHDQVRPRGTLARILGISPLTSDERAWYVGALGEGVVGRMLVALDDRWTVLHAVPVGSGTSDVDHVVIGPGGVFTVNTKHHAGQTIWVASRAFMVSGQKTPYLRNAEYEAERATVRLSRVLPPELDVTPVIALVGPKSITFKEQPAFVKVLDARSLVRWLRKRPIVLDAGQIASIVVAAENPATWHTNPAAEADTRSLQQRFAALDREVRSARLVRLGWATAVLIAFVLAALTMMPLFGRILSGFFV